MPDTKPTSEQLENHTEEPVHVPGHGVMTKGHPAKVEINDDVTFLIEAGVLGAPLKKTKPTTSTED